MPCRDSRDDTDDAFELALLRFLVPKFSNEELWKGVRTVTRMGSETEFLDFMSNMRSYHGRLAEEDRNTERRRDALAKLTKEEVEALGLKNRRR